jgi:hypothetical protein
MLYRTILIKVLLSGRISFAKVNNIIFLQKIDFCNCLLPCHCLFIVVVVFGQICQLSIKKAVLFGLWYGLVSYLDLVGGGGLRGLSTTPLILGGPPPNFYYKSS